MHRRERWCNHQFHRGHVLGQHPELLGVGHGVGEADLPWKGTQAKKWLGATWLPHSGLTLDGAVRNCFFYHRTAVGHAVAQEVTTDITWHGDRAAHFPAMRPDAPILLFDSGVGGLSVLKRVRLALPDAPIVYVADNGGYPYGTKTEGEIAARVPALLGRLVERFRPRLVAIPCNTASTIALAAVRAALQRDPARADRWHDLGVLEARRGQPAAARAA